MTEAATRRQIRALFSDATIAVYQAYSDEIADGALRSGRFAPPFKRDRMTWIKPSFLWMAYRCGWASKKGQDRVLRVDITRAGFEWALEHSCLSHFETGTYMDHGEWSARLADSAVRIQRDPERDLYLRPLEHRSIQIGLGGQAVDRYVDDWTVSISDVTERFQQTGDAVRRGDLAAAEALLPSEAPYPLPPAIAALIGAS